jgi:hypothetical protein
VLDLQREFQTINRAYFGGRLPRDIEISYSERIPHGRVAVSHPHGILPCHPLFCVEDCSRSWIRIDPFFKEWECVVGEALVHELAHMKALIVRDRRLARKLAGHGPVFHKEMLRLAKAGALNPYW